MQQKKSKKSSEILTACFTCVYRPLCPLQVGERLPGTKISSPIDCPIVRCIAKRGSLQIGQPHVLTPKGIINPDFEDYKQRMVPMLN